MAATSGTNINLDVDAITAPLRLIDVGASLKKNGHILFCEADHDNPWDWHIISHSSSTDISALSKAVGESIMTNITGAPDLYRAKFEAYNWLKELDTRFEAYNWLKELEDDGCESPQFKAYNWFESTQFEAYNWLKELEEEGCESPQFKAYNWLKEFEAYNWLKKLEEKGCESTPDKLLKKAYTFIRDVGREESDNLKRIRAYLSIREFLEILYDRGVKKVWLDAICINQCSKEEIEREIPHQADYYKKSKACYVPINGFADEESGRSCKGACDFRVKHATVDLRDGDDFLYPIIAPRDAGA